MEFNFYKEIKEGKECHTRPHKSACSDRKLSLSRIRSILPMKINRYGFHFVFPLMKNEMFSLVSYRLRLGEKSLNRRVISLNEKMPTCENSNIKVLHYSQLRVRVL